MTTQLPLLFVDKITTALLLKETFSLKVADIHREIDRIDADIKRFGDPEYWEEQMEVLGPGLPGDVGECTLLSIEELMEQAGDKSEFMTAHQEYVLERRRELDDQLKQIRELVYLIERQQFVEVSRLLQKEIRMLSKQISKCRSIETDMRIVLVKLQAQMAFFELICTALVKGANAES